MNITEVRIRKIKNDGKMKAVVSITIEDCFVVHDIKIIDGKNGMFIAMPSRRVGEGIYKDIAHPIDIKTRKYIEETIFDKYKKELEEISGSLIENNLS